MKLIWILLLAITCQVNAQSGFEAVFDQTFSPNQLQEDFSIFRQGLEKFHPGLYRYTSKSAMDSMLTELKQGLEMEHSYQEFYWKISAIVAKIKCQHTIAVPKAETLEQIMKEGKFFPLRVFWEFEPIQGYAAFDFSSAASLSPGTKIKSINGQSMEEIYATLIPYFSSDGNILSNKQSRLQYGVDFQLWYYLLIARPEVFTVVLENSDGTVFEREYAAVTLKQWTRNYRKYHSQKDPRLKQYSDHWVSLERKNRANPIRYEFLSDSTVLLTVLNFYSHKFDKIIEKAFSEIEAKGIENLIIDVRYNEGGSDILGRKLFTYVISEPTSYFDSLYASARVADTTFLYKYTDKDANWWKANKPLVYQMPDGKFATRPEANEGLLIQSPSENNFEGNVYILMNGRSASTTAEFTSATHRAGSAVFIGEESGGAYHGGNGGDFAWLRLPNTQIAVEIPLVKYVMNSNENRYQGSGTLPDYYMPTTMQDILQLRDPQLEMALKLIGEK